VLVRDIMRAPVLTVGPDRAIGEAFELTRARQVRHLVVVQGDALAGIVSDRDFKRALGGPAAAAERWAEPVDAIMSRPVTTVDPEAPVEEAAAVMLARRISALPVVEAGRLAGIVTETDLLRLLCRALGATEPSSRLDVGLDDRAGSLGEVLSTLEEAGAPVASVVCLRAPDGRREAVVRVRTINPGPAVRRLEARGHAVRPPWSRP
jgi:acetoin utilization protein AcuB